MSQASESAKSAESALLGSSAAALIEKQKEKIELLRLQTRRIQRTKTLVLSKPLVDQLKPPSAFPVASGPSPLNGQKTSWPLVRSFVHPFCHQSFIHRLAFFQSVIDLVHQAQKLQRFSGSDQSELSALLKKLSDRVDKLKAQAEFSRIMLFDSRLSGRAYHMAEAAIVVCAQWIASESAKLLELIELGQSPLHNKSVTFSLRCFPGQRIARCLLFACGTSGRIVSW